MFDVAVIILPGILGSPLRRVSDGAEVWPVDSTTGMLPILKEGPVEKIERFANPLTGAPYHPRCVVIRSNPDDHDRTNRVATIYHDFIKETHLNDTFVDWIPHVYVVNYDWTRCSLENVASVRMQTDAILLASGCKAYMYVTHSMGVLAALARTIRSPQPVAQSATDPVFLGTVAAAGPINGAPETLRRIRDGVPYSYLSPTSVVVSTLLANEGWKCSILAPHVPGFADLFQYDTFVPVESSVATMMATQFRQTPNFFSSSDYKWGHAHINHLAAQMQANMHRSRKLHDRIDNNVHLWTDNFISVCLTGKETYQRFLDNGDAELRDKKGDGTVPERSQMHLLDEDEQVILVPGGIDHGEALTQPVVFPYIYRAMAQLYEQERQKGRLAIHGQ